MLTLSMSGGGMTPLFLTPSWPAPAGTEVDADILRGGSVVLKAGGPESAVTQPTSGIAGRDPPPKSGVRNPNTVTR
jgi:hypothetical protein